MKFSQMPYTRPEFEQVSEKLTSMIARFKEVKSAKEGFDVYKEIDEYVSHLNSMLTIAYVRNSLDTTDKFYSDERDYIDEVEPKLTELSQQIKLALMGSPFRTDFEEVWGTLMFDKNEMMLKTFKPEIIPDLQEENRLTTEYDKLIASAQIEFDGKTLTLAQLTPYHEEPDRTVRENSMRARADWFMSNSERLDSLFDELVKVRTRIAAALGFENYVQLGYYRMLRVCYDSAMIAKFRDGVTSHIVPIAVRLKAEQAKRIGVDTIKIYDDPFEYPDGNAKPIGTVDEIFEHGKKMYHELSSDTAEFIDFMLENELFDVLTRPGKSSGGYCTQIDEYKAPFIFANFNGTSGDIDVLTHEAGHAFAAYVTRDMTPSDLREITYETAEVHSMSMEFFTWPWMEGFFGAQTEKYRHSHLSSALEFIPYGTMVDEFQHHIYLRPEMSPMERNKLWLELEKKYRPWLDIEGFPFYGEGRRWQAQMHIYQNPFYYIDYCLAQTMALAFWAEDQKDHAIAWSKYRRYAGLGGRMNFVESNADAGLPSPFEPDTLKTVADAAVRWLDK